MNAATMMERTLPHNLESERSVLGAILLHHEALALAADIIAPDDFFRDAHRRIFSAMQALCTKSYAIDLVTLKEQLGADLDECGGPAYISALIDGVPRSTNVEHYARIIKEKAALRSVIFATNKTLAAAYGGEDRSADLATEAVDALRAISDGSDDGGVMRLADLMPSGLKAIETATAAGAGTISGLATGFTQLDDLTSGLQASDLVLIAARTSQGKTALALNIARALTVPVLIFSLEMSQHQLMMRLLASEARVDSHRLRTANLDTRDWGRLAAAYSALAESTMLIYDRPGIGVREVRAQARKAKAKYGIGAVFIDYIQLMKGRGKFDNRTQEIGTISRGLKEVARELNIPIVALSQLSRAVEAQPGKRGARRPQLSDLAESGSLENDADVVLLIYRPEPKDDDPGAIAEIIVGKSRNGPTGVVRLAWNASIVRFENLSL